MPESQFNLIHAVTGLDNQIEAGLGIQFGYSQSMIKKTNSAGYVADPNVFKPIL